MINNSDIQEVILRIRKMEKCFDMLLSAHENHIDPLHHKNLLAALTAYYENGEWLCDYALDEKGLLPKDLKRGVLSQDAVYDFLSEIHEQENPFPL